MAYNPQMYFPQAYQAPQFPIYQPQGRMAEIIPMDSAEAGEEGGYSGRYVYMPRYSGISDATHMGPGTGSYADGSYRSYAQDYSGRRDRMGRFTSRDGGYSYNGSMQSAIEELRGLMGEMPDEKRREVQRFIDKMERM